MPRLLLGLVTIVWLARGWAQPPDPAREAARAQQLVVAGKLDEAIRIYSDLLRASPGNAVLLVNLAIAEYTAKRYEDAVTHSIAALKVNPSLLPARLFLGASYLELGEFAKAIDPLQAVCAANPRERNGRLMLGEALLGLGKPGKAVPHLQTAAAMLPASPRVWYALGRALHSLGRLDDASQAWDRLARLPPSMESHRHAAEVHDREQRWREAAVEWQEALKLAPEDGAVRVGLAWALFRSRDYETAMTSLQPLLSGDSAEVQFLYGASFLNLQRPGEALPYLQHAVASDPKLLPARAALGQALLQTGKAGEAIGFLESARSIDADGSIHYQLFRAYQLAHRPADARQALAEYHRLRASRP